MWERSKSLACRVSEWWRTQTNLHDVVEHVDAESGDELIVVVGRGAQLDAGCV